MEALSQKLCPFLAWTQDVWGVLWCLAPLHWLSPVACEVEPQWIRLFLGSPMDAQLDWDMENLDTMPTSLAVFHVPWAISERFLQCGRGWILPLKSGSAVAMRGCNWPVLKTYFIQGWCVIFCHAGGMWRVGACNFKQRAFFSFCDHPSLFPVWTLRLDQCSKTPTQTESILLNTWRKK